MGFSPYNSSIKSDFCKKDSSTERARRDLSIGTCFIAIGAIMTKISPIFVN